MSVRLLPDDSQLCLGIDGPEAGSKDLGARIENLKGMSGRFQQAFPDKALAMTNNYNRTASWGFCSGC